MFINYIYSLILFYNIQQMNLLLLSLLLHVMPKRKGIVNRQAFVCF